MSTEVSDELFRLENGPARAFRDWPATHFEIGPSGVYTIWKDNVFLTTAG